MESIHLTETAFRQLVRDPTCMERQEPDPFLRRIAQLYRPVRARRSLDTDEPRRWAKAGATLSPGIVFIAISNDRYWRSLE